MKNENEKWIRGTDEFREHSIKKYKNDRSKKKPNE